MSAKRVRISELDFRDRLRAQFTDHVRFVRIEQPLRRTVHDRDFSLGIKADNTCTNACEHRFGKAATFVDLVTRANEIHVLRAQLGRHFVKALAEIGEVAFGLAHRYLNVKIARGNKIGGSDQSTNWCDETVGECEANPSGRQQKNNCKQCVARAKQKMKRRPVRDQQLVSRA